MVHDSPGTENLLPDNTSQMAVGAPSILVLQDELAGGR